MQEPSEAGRRAALWRPKGGRPSHTTNFDFWISLNRTISSRRFMKWNATNIVTLFSKHTNWPKYLYKVLRNFMVSNWTISPSELHQELFFFPFFPRNIQYRGRLKGPPFSFFGTVRLFLNKKCSPKDPPSMFLIFCKRMDVKKSERARQFGPTFFKHCKRILDTLKSFSLRYGADLCRSRLVSISLRLNSILQQHFCI